LGPPSVGPALGAPVPLLSGEGLRAD